MDEAIDALLKREVEAEVYDAPNLIYYVNGEDRGKVAVVGKIFEPQDYGIDASRQFFARKEQPRHLRSDRIR